MAADPFAAIAEPVGADEFAAVGAPADQSDPLDYLDGDQKAIYARLTPEQQKAWSEYKLQVPGLGYPALSVDVTAPSEPPPVLDQDIGRRLYMGVGDVAQSVGDVLGLFTNPINAALNWTGIPQALTGQELGTDLSSAARDMTGAPDPVTDSERYASMINRGGAGALLTAGAAVPMQAARGVTGAVARAVAGNPTRDLIGGVAGGAAGEAGGDAGESAGEFVGGETGGRVGRMVGTLTGGLTGAVGAMSAARKAEEALDGLLRRYPREVLFDDAGNLTEDGVEAAHRAGVGLDEIIVAARRRNGRVSRDSRTPQERQAALEAETARITQAMGRRLPAGSAGDPNAAPPPADPGGGAQPPARPVFEEAREEGIRLTRGQAEQDFSIQNDENSLRVSGTKEGNAARAFFAQQAEDIKGAVQRFRSSIGGDPGDAAGRGESLKQAIRTLRDSGREGVRELYREAEALGGEGLALPIQGIRDAATDVLIDEAVPESIKRSVSQELARYGIIGKAEATNEAGLTRVMLDDGSSIQFRGPVKELTASNAEDLRQAINRLYDPTKPNLSGQSIKPAIDDALEEALTGASSREGAIGNAYRAARDAHQTQQRTFKAKDIIENLIAVKKGTETDVVLPEKAVAQVIGNGPDGVSNLRKVRALLLSSNTPSSRQAWSAIKHQALADIFDAALIRNSNTGGEIVETISGAKLRTAIFDKFGVEKLRAVLDPQEFSQLMKLQRIIGSATIPMTGTTNPSGTFTKLVNYMKAGVLRMSAPIPGVNMAVDATGNLLAKAKELSTTRKTLEGITNYNGPDSARSIDQRARDFVLQYIQDGKAGRLLPSSISLSASQGGSGRN